MDQSGFTCNPNVPEQSSSSRSDDGNNVGEAVDTVYDIEEKEECEGVNGVKASAGKEVFKI